MHSEIEHNSPYRWLGGVSSTAVFRMNKRVANAFIVLILVFLGIYDLTRVPRRSNFDSQASFKSATCNSLPRSKALCGGPRWFELTISRLRMSIIRNGNPHSEEGWKFLHSTNDLIYVICQPTMNTGELS